MDTTVSEIPTIIGTPFGGGFYAGRICIESHAFAIIAAPKEEGELEDATHESALKRVDGAASFFDGRANTEAFADAGSELARWARGLRIGGFDDWYIPSRDELEILYRAFKPTVDQNYCGSGDNPSSIPEGYAYFHDTPAQTTVEAFKADSGEAFEPAWYWSSTQYAGLDGYAWVQLFFGGLQTNVRKDFDARARAVRRVAI